MYDSILMEQAFTQKNYFIAYFIVQVFLSGKESRNEVCFGLEVVARF